jgi:hypothetical protein
MRRADIEVPNLAVDVTLNVSDFSERRLYLHLNEMVAFYGGRKFTSHEVVTSISRDCEKSLRGQAPMELTSLGITLAA